MRKLKFKIKHMDDYTKGYVVGWLVGAFCVAVIAKMSTKEKKKDDPKEAIPEIHTYYDSEKERPYSLTMIYRNPKNNEEIFKGGMTFLTSNAMMRYLYEVSYEAFELCKRCS